MTSRALAFIQQMFALAAGLLFFAAGAATAAVAADYHYQGKLVIEPASGFLKANWTIEVRSAGTSNITFYICDSLNQPTINGKDVVGSTVEKVSGFDDFWALTVTLTPAQKNAARKIEIDYDGVLLPEPLPNKINSITPNVVELNVDSFWFPMDASFSKLLSAELEIEIDGNWQGISTGNVSVTGGRIKIENKDPRLDIAFTLARSPNLIENESLTIFDLRAEATGIDALIKTAEACTKELNGLFGDEQSLPKSKLVITDRNESGYARENYIALTDIGGYTPERLTLFLCHEFAHFWAKGADFAGVENWLNESFAEYAALITVRRILGDDAYNDYLERFETQLAGEELPPVWREGLTERGPYLVLYRKAPLTLVAFEKLYGEEQLIEIVRRFFNQPNKTTPALLAIVQTVSGVDAAKRLRELLAF